MARHKANKKNTGYLHTPEIAITLQQAFQHMQSGHTDMVRSLCESILKNSPRHPKALNLMGVIHAQQEDYSTAADYFRRAIKADPNDAHQHRNLGNILLKQQDTDNAIKCFKKALQLTPDNIEVLNALGTALREKRKYKEALSYFKKAIAIQPQYAEAYSSIAEVLKYQGQIDLAVDNYHQALKLKPSLYNTWFSLAHSKRFTDHNDNDIRTMEESLQAPGISTEQKIHLNFALAKAYEDLKDYDKSFAFLKDGNTLKRSTFSFNITDEEECINLLIDACDSQLFERHQQHGYNKKGPIFIVGMPRSGTTLTEQILASHPDVFGADEIPDFDEAINKFGLNLSSGNFPEQISQLTAEQLTKMGSEYMKRLQRYSNTAPYIINKHLYNFILIGFIRLTLPQAKIIHCMRDPLDTCLSCYKHLFTPLHKYIYDLTELGQYYRLYQRLMDHWRSVIPDAFLDFKYEALIANQEEQTRKLLDYCGLDWNEACLNFHRTDRAVKTASYGQVRKSIYTTSVKHWKQYEKHLQPLFTSLQIKP